MSIKKKYQGIIVPAITPLLADHTLDEAAVEKLLTFFRRHEVLPFILGTTGEAPSLPLAVKHTYIRLAGRMKRTGELLYAGVSSNCLEDSVEMGKYCFGEGVDVAVATLPSYYTLTDDQMKRYFEQLAERIGGPLIIYNIPATTHLSVPLKIIDELSHHPGIIGTKDSERNEERLKASLDLWAQREDFSHFLGWAARSAEALLNGSDGLVPSTGNINPGLYQEMYKAVQKGQKEKAMELQELSDQLGNTYQTGRSLGESLAALKLIMQKQGLCQPYMMSPL
jgi:4-hydroxy-tetrahydrodipicolinate synthase